MLPGCAFLATQAGEGIRTLDPLITNQMLYQLSYASRKLPTLAKRKPNCKGICETSKLIGGRLSAPSFSSMLVPACPPPLWLVSLFGLSFATTPAGVDAHSVRGAADMSTPA